MRGTRWRAGAAAALAGLVVAGDHEVATAAPVRSVRVPAVVGSAVGSAYARLHAAGLTVTIPRGFELESLIGGERVVASTPMAGRRVASGSAVSLVVACRPCLLDTPALPDRLPVYRVPEFVGGPASAPQRWVSTGKLYLTERFGPLSRAAAGGLLANDDVARQRPAPGARLRLGIAGTTRGNDGTFTPTPLTVWLREDR